MQYNILVLKFCFIVHKTETEEGFVKLFSKKLGFAEDVEPAEEVRTEIQSTEEQEEEQDDGSPEIKNIRHLAHVNINS